MPLSDSFFHLCVHMACFLCFVSNDSHLLPAKHCLKEGGEPEVLCPTPPPWTVTDWWDDKKIQLFHFRDWQALRCILHSWDRHGIRLKVRIHFKIISLFALSVLFSPFSFPCFSWEESYSVSSIKIWNMYSHGALSHMRDTRTNNYLESCSKSPRERNLSTHHLPITHLSFCQVSVLLSWETTLKYELYSISFPI